MAVYGYRGFGRKNGMRKLLSRIASLLRRPRSAQSEADARAGDVTRHAAHAREPETPGPGTWHCAETSSHDLGSRMGTHKRFEWYSTPMQLVTAFGDTFDLPSSADWVEVVPGVFVRLRQDRRYLIAARAQAMPIFVRHQTVRSMSYDDNWQANTDERSYRDEALDAIPVVVSDAGSQRQFV